MLNRLHKIVPLQLELIPLLLIVFIIWFTAANFSGLPEIIPTHFNFQGTADDWGGKGALIIIPAIGLFVYLLITGIAVALSLINDPKTLINLPASIKARISPERAEELRVFLVRCLFALKLLIMAMFTYLVYGSIEIAFNKWSGLGYWPMLIVFLILILVFLMVYRSLRMAYIKK
jgi:uncharacterized membrane protein